MCWGVKLRVREVGQESVAHPEYDAADTEAVTVEKDSGGWILRDL